MKYPLVSVIVVNFNGKKYLQTCFESLFSINYPKDKLEVIMVDNGSEDGSVEFINDKFPDIKVILSEKNNYCYANNIAIKESKGEYVALLNNDTEVDKNWLIELVKVIVEDEKIGAVGSKILFPDGRIQSVGHIECFLGVLEERGYGEDDSGQYDVLYKVDSIPGASVLYRKSCFDLVGYFDEDFVMYFEDVDMSYRIRSENYNLLCVPTSRVMHRGKGTVLSSQWRYYMTKNRFLYLAKHFPEDLNTAFSSYQNFIQENDVDAEKSLCNVLSAVICKMIKENKHIDLDPIVTSFVYSIRLLINFDKLKSMEMSYVLKEELRNSKCLLKAELKEKEEQLKEKDTQLKVELERYEKFLKEKDGHLEVEAKRYKAELKEKEEQGQNELSIRDKLLREKDMQMLSEIESRDDLIKDREKIIQDQTNKIFKEISARDMRIIRLSADLGNMVKEKVALNQKVSDLLKENDELSKKVLTLAKGLERNRERFSSKIVEINMLREAVDKWKISAVDQHQFFQDTLEAVKEKVKMQEKIIAFKEATFQEKKHRFVEIIDSLENEKKELFAKLEVSDREQIELRKTSQTLLLRVSNLEKNKQDNVEELKCRGEAISSQRNVIQQKEALLNKKNQDMEDVVGKYRAHVELLNQDLNMVLNSKLYKLTFVPYHFFITVLRRLFKGFGGLVSRVLILPLLIIKELSRLMSTVRLKTNSNSSDDANWVTTYLKNIKQKSVPPQPKYMSLMITSRCNLNCLYCDIPQRNYDKKELTKAEILKIIDEAFQLGITTVEFTGGEPFIHPDIFEVIQYSASLGLKVCVSSNGLLVEQYKEQLLNSGIDRISISIDGFKETHNVLRNHNFDYDKLMNTIDVLLQNDMGVSVNFVVTKTNIYELEDIFNLFTEKNIYVAFFPVINKPDLAISKKKEWRIFRDFVESVYKKGFLSKEQLFYYKNMHKYYAKKNHVRCLGLSRTFGVDVNGNLYACCVWSNKERPFSFLGNAISENINQMWYSEKANKMRQLLHKKGCGDCYNPDIADFSRLVGKSFFLKKTKVISNKVISNNVVKEQTSNKELSLTERPSPTSVHMRLTLNCNLSCKHCDIWQIKKSTNLSTEDWKKIIDRLHGWLGSFWLELAGGEMFVRKDIAEIIKYTHDKGIETNITSNALLINKCAARDIYDSGLRALTVSIDGSNASTHDFIRNKKGAFQDLFKNMQYLHDIREKEPRPFDINIATVINDKNLDELEDIISLTKDNIFSSITFQAIDNNFASKYSNDWYKRNKFWPKDTNKVVSKIDRIIELKNSGYVINNSIEQFEAMKKYFSEPALFSYSTCNSGQRSIIVNEKGEVLLCWNLPGIGNLLDDSPVELWNSKEARKKLNAIENCKRTCRLLNCNF